MIVRDVFTLSSMKDAYVKAGSGGLDGKLNTVTVLEVTDIHAQNWLVEGQLFITSLYAVMNSVEKQLEIIEVLIKSKSSGIVICHIDLWLKSIDERIVELCDKHNYPLIVANSDTSYIEIMNPIILKLMAEASEDYSDTTYMQNKMIELVANKKDVGIIYRTMSEYYKNKIWFLDIDNRLIYPKYDEEFLTRKDRFLTEINVSADKPKAVEKLIDLDNKTYIIMRVYSEGVYYGVIIAETDKAKVYYQTSILEAISMIIVLIATKRRRVSELEKRKREEYLSDLITWNFRSDDVALKLGLDINWDISKIEQVIVINMNSYQERTGEDLRELEKHIESVQYSRIKDVIKTENPYNIVGKRSDLIIILLGIDETNSEDRVKRLCEKIINNWETDLSGDISIGISDTFFLYRHIPKAYRQAMETVRFSREYFGNNICYEFRDMGAFSYLKVIKEDKEVMNSLENLFIDLLEYDNKNNTELYNTLSQLILNNMNINTVSKAMFLHKNTILYRKNKIAEVLGYEPWNMPYLLNSLLWFLMIKED